MRRHARVLFAIAALTALSAVAAPQALAGYQEVGTFASNPFDESPALEGAGTADGYVFNPGQADVNEASGKLYVADTNNDRVEVFKPNPSGGEYDSKVAITAPTGLAIDQATGDVYVANATGIVKYDSALNPIVVGWTDPGVSGTLAVDPTNGDLLVADQGANLVRRFDSDGTALGTFAAERPLDVAVRPSGEILVVTSTGDISGKACTADSAVRRFSSAGAPEGAIGGLEVPGAVEVGPGDSILVATHLDSGGFCLGPDPTVVYLDSDETTVESIALPGSGFATVPTLAGKSSRLYAITKSPNSNTFGRTKIYAFKYVPTPAAIVSAVDPGTITIDEAALAGTVNPNGLATSYRFEYSADDGASWSSTATENAGSGEAKVSVSAQLTGLNFGTAYEVRLFAENAEGTSTSLPVSFTTDNSPPFVQALEAIQVTDTSARLRASVNPASEPTTYYFEYGTDTSYGSAIPAARNGYAGKALGATVVAENLTGLQPNTTYHFRVVASNASGTAEGADQTFTTTAASPACANEAIRQAQRSTFLPECRAYEQVSPVDKNGANVSQAEHNPDTPEPLSAASAVAPSGDQLTYVLSGPLADAEASTLYNLANAHRTADGWSSRSATAPQASWVERPMFATSVAISPTTTLEYSELALAPGAVEGEGNYYLRDSATGTYELIAAIEDPVAALFEQQPSLAVGPDFAVFGQTHALTPDATELSGVNKNLYSYYQGQLHLLNEPGSATHPESQNDIRARAVSEDGSRVYFLQEGGSGTGLYLSEDGERGVPISVSHVPGDPQTPQEAIFLGASEDGSVAYFTSRVQLTDDVEPGLLGDVLYRYTADDGELTAITPTSESGNAGVSSYSSGNISTPVSADGSTVYFLATGALVPEAMAGSTNIYAWHDGETRLVATMEQGLPARDLRPQWSVSPDGTKLAFLAQSSLTAYDTMGGKACALALFGNTTGPCVQAYLYDWDTDEVSCASCPEVGVAPQGHAALGGMTRLSVGPGQTTFTTSVTDGGAVFFDTPQKLVPTDTNGKRDVYEFKDGEAKLISSGKSDAESVFHGLSADGRDVFFGTTERLVGQDDDNQVDLYDARVDGGFASQQASSTDAAPCSGSGCQGPPAPPPGARSMGSSSFQGAGNASPRRSKAKKRCVPKKRSAKKRAGGKQRAHAKSKQTQQRAKACKGGNR